MLVAGTITRYRDRIGPQIWVGSWNWKRLSSAQLVMNDSWTSAEEKSVGRSRKVKIEATALHRTCRLGPCWCRAAIPPPTRKGCFVKGAPSLVTRKNVSSSDPNRGRLRPLSFPSPSRFSFTSRTLNCLLPSARATACKLRDGGRGGVEDLGSFPLQSQSERRHPSRAGICDRE